VKEAPEGREYRKNMPADDWIGKMIAERIGQDINMDLVKPNAKGLDCQQRSPRSQSA
jgi:hypothetical protein